MADPGLRQFTPRLRGWRRMTFRDMRPVFRLFVGSALVLAMVIPAPGQEEGVTRLPEDARRGIAHLLSLVGPGAPAAFAPETVAGLLRFVDQRKDPDALYAPDPIDGASSAYLDVDVRMDWAEFLKRTFHPTVPWFTTTPSSLRLAVWSKTDRPWRGFPRLWELLEPNGPPVVIRGMETVENTPDLFTGGYYRYDLFRTLVLFRNGDRRVLISLSRQAGPSEVGKKGYILGPDDDWNYFYSDEPGLTVTGLGWVKSLMYDSIGISIYTEMNAEAQTVRTANIKWVRAGWAHLNVVRRDHILRGMQRFARTLKAILESPRLPPVQTMEADMARISQLTDAEIRERIRVYRTVLAARGERAKDGGRKSLPESFWDEGVWNRMTREEMESTLILEAFKAHLGKTTEEEACRVMRVPSSQTPCRGG
jgi:hypothetical protein